MAIDSAAFRQFQVPDNWNSIRRQKRDAGSFVYLNGAACRNGRLVALYRQPIQTDKNVNVGSFSRIKVIRGG